jgi:hypothetical protein
MLWELSRICGVVMLQRLVLLESFEVQRYCKALFVFMVWLAMVASYSCVRDSRYTPRGVVHSTDQREYRIARPRRGHALIRKGSAGVLFLLLEVL